MTRARPPRKRPAAADALRRAEEELARLRAELADAIAANEQRARGAALIDELNAILHACSTRAEAYPLLGGLAARLFPRMNGALAVPAHGTRFQTVAQWGTGAPMAGHFAVRDCWALKRGEMHVADGTGREPACRHYSAKPPGLTLCLPLAIDGGTIGLLHFDGDTRLSPAERAQIVKLGDVLRIALADLKLREELRLQAIRDPLTGLFNRQYLDETLPRECQLAERRNSPLSVVMLDIDQFKRFNDDYGHAAGDVVLRELGALLRTAVRSSDIACRYGGEEFVLVLLDMGSAAATARLQQICRDIKRKRCIYAGRILPSITVSAGIAEFPVHGSTPAEIIRAADEAMYAAKRAGRDRVAASSRRAARPRIPMQA
jgi:diguanylate cyclase (GGDEF)-like protein